MYNLTTQVLHSIFDKNTPIETVLSSVRDSSIRNMFFFYNKEDIIIQQHDPVKYIYFLLKGSASVITSISWTSSDIIDTLFPLDILGLVELLNDQSAYTAYVVADTPCTVLRIPVPLFQKIIKQEASLCYETLRILGNITMHNMDRAETNSIFHSYDRLCHFLYLKAQGHIPYTFPHTRKELSDDLHINLRTLYRYIGTMEKEGYLKLKHGKIIIEEEHLEKLFEKYGSVTL